MDEDFRLVADLNGGYLHRAQILEHGGSDDTIRRALAAGLMRRIRVGTYVFAGVHDLLTPLEKHVVLARATIDKFPPGSVALCHQSAAAFHGIETWGLDLDVVHLVRLDGGPGRRESGVVHHSHRPADDELVVVDGRTTIEPVRAMWEVACTSSRRSGLVVMDSALHQGLILPEELADPEGRFMRFPGSRVARLMARLADGGAENPGETLLRYVCIENRLPPPDTQFVIVDADGSFLARTDLGWELLRHVAEFDGLRKYWRDLRPGEDTSAVVVREKLREDAIRGREYGASRSVWPEVQPEASKVTGRRLEADLERSHRVFAKGRRHIA